MRVIIPLLTSQYLNLIKNSSLAVFIGYPDLVQVFAGTVLNQTGAAVQVIVITMAVYLAISLLGVAGDEFLRAALCAAGALAWTQRRFVRRRSPRRRRARRRQPAQGRRGGLRASLFDGWRASLLTIARSGAAGAVALPPLLRFLDLRRGVGGARWRGLPGARRRRLLGLRRAKLPYFTLRLLSDRRALARRSSSWRSAPS